MTVIPTIALNGGFFRVLWNSLLPRRPSTRLRGNLNVTDRALDYATNRLLASDFGGDDYYLDTARRIVAGVVMDIKNG